MIDVKIGQPIKEESIEKFNEIKYIQDYIKYYYEKTNEQIRLNKTLLTIAIILLIANIIPDMIKLIILIKII